MDEITQVNNAALERLLNGENTGFIAAEPSASAYVFGSTSKIDYAVINPSAIWDPYLPDDEMQIGVYFDTMACVTFSAMNVLETLCNFYYKTGIFSAETIALAKQYGYIDPATDKFNFSDRFIAKLSGTTKSGNTMENVANAIYKYGLVPESKWPYPRLQRTPVFDWDNYYSEISQDVIDFGKHIFEIIKINFEFFYDNDFQAHLKQGPFQVATAICPGWDRSMPNPVPACSAVVSHAHEIYGQDISQNFKDFDSYNPFRQLLASNYNLNWRFKYVVTPAEGLPNMSSAILVGTNKDADGKFTEFGFYSGAISADGLKNLADERGYALPLKADSTPDFDALQGIASELVKK